MGMEHYGSIEFVLKNIFGFCKAKLQFSRTKKVSIS